jgi:hypothetical protein
MKREGEGGVLEGKREVEISGSSRRRERWIDMRDCRRDMNGRKK